MENLLPELKLASDSAKVPPWRQSQQNLPVPDRFRHWTKPAAPAKEDRVIIVPRGGKLMFPDRIPQPVTGGSILASSDEQVQPAGRITIEKQEFEESDNRVWRKGVAGSVLIVNAAVAFVDAPPTLYVVPPRGAIHHKALISGTCCMLGTGIKGHTSLFGQSARSDPVIATGLMRNLRSSVRQRRILSGSGATATISKPTPLDECPERWVSWVASPDSAGLQASAPAVTFPGVFVCFVPGDDPGTGKLPCSAADRDPVIMRFRNQHLSHHMEVSWLDFEGHAVHRYTLPPGEDYIERAWATQPWLVRDRDEERAILIVPGSEFSTGKHHCSFNWDSNPTHTTMTVRHPPAKPPRGNGGQGAGQDLTTDSLQGSISASTSLQHSQSLESLGSTTSTARTPPMHAPTMHRSREAGLAGAGRMTLSSASLKGTGHSRPHKHKQFHRNASSQASTSAGLSGRQSSGLGVDSRGSIESLFKSVASEAERVMEAADVSTHASITITLMGSGALAAGSAGLTSTFRRIKR